MWENVEWQQVPMDYQLQYRRQQMTWSLQNDIQNLKKVVRMLQWKSMNMNDVSVSGIFPFTSVMNACSNNENEVDPESEKLDTPKCHL